MSPVLAFDSASPAAKGARLERRIEEAREQRALRTPAPALVPSVLSPNSVNEFTQVCQVRWYYRKVLELPERRSAHLGLGTALHVSCMENFRQKMHTHRDLPTEHVVGLFRSAWREELDQITLEKGDDPADLQEAGEVMTRVYMERAAPAIRPAAVEAHVAGRIGGVAVQGYPDVVTERGDIIDLKSARRATKAVPAGYRNQVATYAMLVPDASGKARLDTVTKGKTVNLTQTTVNITDSDKHHTTRLYSIAKQQMESGLYAPNRASNLCTRKYCAYWERCMADYGGEVSR
jgi:hypothetical protein